MARTKGQEDDVISLSSSNADADAHQQKEGSRKRKRRRSSSPASSDGGGGHKSPASSSSSTNSRPTAAKSNSRQVGRSSQTGRAIKQSSNSNGNNGTNTATRPGALNKGKGRAQAGSTTDSDEDSEEEIVVVAYSKTSSAAPSARPSSSKPSSSHKSHHHHHKQRHIESKSHKHAKISKLVQEDNDEEVEDDDNASRGSSLKNFRTSKDKENLLIKALKFAEDNEEDNHSQASTSRGKATSRHSQSHQSNGGESHRSSQAHQRLAKREISNSPKPKPSPKKASTNGHAHHAKHREDGSDDYLSPGSKSQVQSQVNKGDSETVNVKRSNAHIANLKRQYNEAEDRFNEVSARCEKLASDVASLTQEKLILKKLYDDNLGKMKIQVNGTDDAQRQAQVQIGKFEHDMMNVRAQHDKIVLALQTELARAKAQTLPARSLIEDIALAKEEAEIEEKLRRQKKDFEAIIDDLKTQIAEQQRDGRLAQKEREIENLHSQYTRQLADLRAQNLQLQTLHNIDKQAMSVDSREFSRIGGIPLSEDVQHLQKLVTSLNRQNHSLELQFQSTMETYEARIKKMQKEDEALVQKCRNQIDSLEQSRKTLEFDRERFKGQVISLTRERDSLYKEIGNLRGMKSRYEHYKRTVPKMEETLKETRGFGEVMLQENTSLRNERTIYVKRMQDIQDERDECMARLQAVNTGMTSTGSAELQQKYSEWKQLSRTERQRYKAKIRQLEKKLKRANRYVSASGNGALLDSSEEEDGSDIEASDARPSASYRDDDDLADALFDDDQHASISRSRKVALARPRSPSPSETLPEPLLANEQLKEKVNAVRQRHSDQLRRYEEAKPPYQFPPIIRSRAADTKVPRHDKRVYIRSECHTPYVPDETVSDSDDEFLEWESQAYAKNQSQNPDRKAAIVNICWNRHILDMQTNRVRSTNLNFCVEFVESYAPLIASRDAGAALLKHILKMVDLGQLSADEGGTVIRAYHESLQ